MENNKNFMLPPVTEETRRLLDDAVRTATVDWERRLAGMRAVDHVDVGDGDGQPTMDHGVRRRRHD